jgi:hypothetical protein
VERRDIPSWSASLQTLVTQQVTPAMKVLASQMHFGLRLQLAGMELVTQESVDPVISSQEGT